MKRVLTTIALVAGLVFVATPAQAEDEEVLRLDSRVMCVRADFPVTGSGWKVHAAIREWNRAQKLIRLTTVSEAGCATVYVHRYRAEDGRCAGTIWDRVWSSARQDVDGAWLVDGADIWLNDLCDPSFNKLWSRWTVAHELGHALGLPHNTSPRSVVSTAPVFDSTRPLIAPVDVRNLATLYRHQ